MSLFSIGSNTLTGTVGTGVGGIATSIVSAAGTLSLAGPVQASGTTVFGARVGIAPSGGSYVLSGPLSGTGSLSKVGGGTLFLDPSSTADFSGTLEVSTTGLQVGQNSIRITQNGVVGSRAAQAGRPNVWAGAGGLLEVRMDSPRVELSGSMAGTPATIGFSSDAALSSGVARTSLFIDHAVGSLATGGSLTSGPTIAGAGEG